MSRRPKDVARKNRQLLAQGVEQNLHTRLRLCTPTRAVGLAFARRRPGERDDRRDLLDDMAIVEARGQVHRAGRVRARHLEMLVIIWKAAGLSDERVRRRLRSLAWFFEAMGRDRLVADFLKKLKREES